MAAARIYQREPRTRLSLLSSMLSWAVLSMLPDADVIGFRYGVRYASTWGHRGATHSMVFALGVALACGALAPVFRRPALRTALVAAVVVGSHALLDTWTDGGLGCALWWPFDARRYFAPWRPIPVAPIGLRFFGSAGLAVAAIELLQFSPCVIYALWPRRAPAASELPRNR